MLMFLPQRWYYHNLGLTDGLTVLAWIEIVAIYQPSYNTSHRIKKFIMKPSDPLMLTDVTLCCGMYPACKVDIYRHLAIPGFPQSNHTVGKWSGIWFTVKWSIADLLTLNQPPICLDYKSMQTDPTFCVLVLKNY